MIRVTRQILPIKQEKEIEDSVAQTAINRDTLEYVAMMSDVDLGTDTMEYTGDEDNEQ